MGIWNKKTIVLGLQTKYIGIVGTLKTAIIDLVIIMKKVCKILLKHVADSPLKARFAVKMGI